MSAARVQVFRGGVVESEHRVHIAVADGSGTLRASAGDVARVCFARSAVKPLQAVPLIDDGAVSAFEMSERELAVCCASHSGEPYHTDTVLGVLKRIGLGEEALACGAHPPFHEPSAQRLRQDGRAPGPVHNNCSGKHAGMLALARVHGWPTPGYHEAVHPVQWRMLEEISRWSGRAVDEIGLGTDGCGVATFALPLAVLAAAFGRFAREARSAGASAARITEAMVRHPEYVGGSGRLCTELMRVVDGRVVTKVGAEGMYCAALPGAELGIALKVEDGAKRAAEPALVALLCALGLLSDEERASLSAFAEPDSMNTRGDVVGGIRAVVALEAH